MASLKEYRTTKEAFDNEAKNGKMFSEELTECDKLAIKYLTPLAFGVHQALEIGCGMGNVLGQIDSPIIGLDISKEMLEHCRYINPIVGNMDELPFLDNQFDLVYMVMTLQHSLNPEKTLDEATRVLKEGCPLVVIDGDKESEIGKQRENDPNWEKCGDAKWFTEQFFTDMGFEVTHLAPHIMAAKIIKDSWTMEFESMKIITDYIKKYKPKVVVELGSGKSSDRLTSLGFDTGMSYMASFENNPEFMRAGLQYSHKGDWYDLKDFPPKIDLLIIDGPAGTIPMARKPAEQLFTRTKVAFLHDTIRDDEKKMLKEWGKKHKITTYNTLYGIAKIEIC